jgi:hypothetical protein
MKNLYQLKNHSMNAIGQLYYLSDSERELQELLTIGRKAKAARKAKKEAKKTKRTAKKEVRQVKKTGRKEKRTVKKEERKAKGGILRRVLRVPMAPARAAFLGAVSLNALKLATKMLQAYRKDQTKVKKFWQKSGGDWAKLAKAISKGSKTQISGQEELGAVVAGLVAAAPLIIAVTALFRELGVFSPGEEEKYKEVSDEATKALYQDENIEQVNAAMPEDSESITLLPKQNFLQTEEGANLLDKLQQDGSGDVSRAAEIIKTEETESAPDDETDEDTEGMSTTNKLLIGGGILAAILFFTKSK